MTHWPLRLTGYICCHGHISSNHGKEPTSSVTAIRGELDGDGGGSDWCGYGGAGERLGGGASNHLNCVVTRLSVECCECQYDRFPGC